MIFFDLFILNFEGRLNTNSTIVVTVWGLIVLSAHFHKRVLFYNEGLCYEATQYNLVRLTGQTE